ncbi:hypothetical protein ACU686_15195 [Yinghuangia aomiensis]
MMAAYKPWAAAWRDWADQERRREPVVRAYEDLYTMQQSSAELAESYELVLAFGQLMWHRGGHEIDRPLVVARAVVHYDAATGELTVGPDPDRPATMLEEDMLEAEDRPGRDVAAHIGQLLAQAAPFGAEHIEAVRSALTAWALGADVHGRFTDDAPARGIAATYRRSTSCPNSSCANAAAGSS